jgi:hypothetical protein
MVLLAKRFFHVFLSPGNSLFFQSASPPGDTTELTPPAPAHSGAARCWTERLTAKARSGALVRRRDGRGVSGLAVSATEFTSAVAGNSRPPLAWRAGGLQHFGRHVEAAVPAAVVFVAQLRRAEGGVR